MFKQLLPLKDSGPGSNNNGIESTLLQRMQLVYFKPTDWVIRLDYLV